LINSAAAALRRLISYGENYEISASQYLLVFLSVSFLRNFIEGALEATRHIGTGADFETTVMQMGVLFNFEWMTLFCALALVIHFFSKTNIIHLMKMLLFASIFIAIVPFLDFAFYFPSGCKIDYLYTMNDYLKALKYFFIPGADAGVCFGIRVEVFVSFILCGGYVYYKSKNILRSLLSSLSLYFLSVSSMAYPVFILLPFAPFNPGGFDSFVNKFFFQDSSGGDFLRRNSIMIFLLLVPLLALLHAIFYGKKSVKTLLGNIFSPRAFLFAAAFFCGFMLAPKHNLFTAFSNPFDFFLLISGALTAALFSYYMDHDKRASSAPAGDKIVVGVLILLSSMALSSGTFLFYLFLIVIDLFYNTRPFNARSLPFFRYTFPGLIVFILYCAGFSMVGGASLFSFQALGTGLLFFLIVSFIYMGVGRKNNSIVLSLLFVSYAALPPALASFTVMIPAVLSAFLGVMLSYKIKDPSKSLNAQTLLFAMFLIIICFII
jgi:hypothetical protein